MEAPRERRSTRSPARRRSSSRTATTTVARPTASSEATANEANASNCRFSWAKAVSSGVAVSLTAKVVTVWPSRLHSGFPLPSSAPHQPCWRLLPRVASAVTTGALRALAARPRSIR